MTHVDDDVLGVVVGQKDTYAAAVLHGFVVVKVQFAHLPVAAPCLLWGPWALGRPASAPPSAGPAVRFSGSPKETRLRA